MKTVHDGAPSGYTKPADAPDLKTMDQIHCRGISTSRKYVTTTDVLRWSISDLEMMFRALRRFFKRNDVYRNTGNYACRFR